MANTLKKIQTVTVGSGGAASIDFTSIPQTYTDLKIVVSARTTAVANRGSLLLELNGSSSDFTARALYGEDNITGSEIPSPARRLGVVPAANATASAFGSAEIYIPNYTSANFKSISTDIVFEQNSSSVYDLYMTATLWSNTAAITSLSLKPSADNWAQYSSATLYGVSNVTAAQNAYATGGIITYDDTYVYHTFPWSGTFTPTRSLNVDYLVVAGGGGGGAAGVGSGGGGAGGVRCTVGATGGGGSLESQLAVTATAYTVTVGAGGAAYTASTYNTTRNNGSNSVFGSVTSTGGGGASAGAIAGASGGSGGGGSGGNATAGGAGTANQGYAGGTGGITSGNYAGGGGGGAGAVGQNIGASGLGGNGGAGIATSISGSSVTYGGGGGAGSEEQTPGTGGAGGGGNGVKQAQTPGNSGTINTGGGGGGSGRNVSITSGAGGSGIVIVRYAR